MNAQKEISESLGRLKELARGGYAMALHIEFTTPAYLFQTYPKAWIDYYSQNGLVMRDPTVMWGFDNLGMIDWSELSDSDPDRIMDQAREHGIDNGFTYALEVGDHRTICSFAKGSEKFPQSEIDQIKAEVDRMCELTLGLDTLAPETRDALRKMSILFTHPGPDM